MRLLRTLVVLALLACTLQIAFACGKDQEGSAGAAGQPPKSDQTVFVSVLLTNSGFVHDAVVIGEPTALGRAAIRAVRKRRYRNKAVDNWTSSRVSKSFRHITLTVTFPRKKGAPPKIQPGLVVAPGVSSCVVGGVIKVAVVPPSVVPSWLFSMQPVMPVLAPDKVKIRVINGNNSQPIPKQGVFVQLLYEKPSFAPTASRNKWKW